MTSDRLIPDAVRKSSRDNEKTNTDIEDYVLELVLLDLDPDDRLLKYLKVAKSLLEQAEEELGKGDVCQASEKLWGTAALAIKAYAERRDGKRLTSHGELWECKRILERDLGDWVHDAWMNATSMHVCFYEGLCAAEDVDKATERIRKLVLEVERKIKQ